MSATWNEGDSMTPGKRFEWRNKNMKLRDGFRHLAQVKQLSFIGRNWRLPSPDVEKNIPFWTEEIALEKACGECEIKDSCNPESYGQNSDHVWERFLDLVGEKDGRAQSYRDSIARDLRRAAESNYRVVYFDIPREDQ